MKAKSKTPLAADALKGEWHALDAQNKVLGRIATQAVVLLLGKHRPDAKRHVVAPVYVVITNTDKVVVTGQKERAKVYTHYTGYPSGIRTRSVQEQRRRDSRRLIRAAVSGMLPKNSLRERRLSHLKLYPGDKHPHAGQVNRPPA